MKPRGQNLSHNGHRDKKFLRLWNIHKEKNIGSERSQSKEEAMQFVGSYDLV